MNQLIISCSLNPGSRSRLLALGIKDNLKECGCEVDFLDLRKTQMPLCDGSKSSSAAIDTGLHQRVEKSDGIVMCVPIYNFDVNAAAKNLIELTGSSWTGKVVGFACAAGGKSSYMSVMGVANSLMLDFRCHILPRFVYATGESFDQGSIIDEDLQQRLTEFSDEMTRVTQALCR
jgi:FMN reductase